VYVPPKGYAVKPESTVDIALRTLASTCVVAVIVFMVVLLTVVFIKLSLAVVCCAAFVVAWGALFLAGCATRSVEQDSSR
jgi:hypothetical protein